MRKVHAGHAIDIVGSWETGVVVPETGGEEGSDVARGSGAGTALRGTPQSEHILAADGLRPGGLRYAQTSHSQLSKAGTAVVMVPDPRLSEELGAVKYSVALGEELNSPP